jgi:putative membrane protein
MLWIKAFHIISMVAWFSGIFYLPRLFVYHSMQSPEENIEERTPFKTMERRLCYGIMTPSGILTILSGLWLLYNGLWTVYSKSGWLHAKLGLVVLLVIYNIYCIYLVQQFKHNKNTHSPKYYRFFNEIPVFILIGCVILVVLKPF